MILSMTWRCLLPTAVDRTHPRAVGRTHPRAVGQPSQAQVTVVAAAEAPRDRPVCPAARPAALPVIHAAVPPPVDAGPEAVVDTPTIHVCNGQRVQCGHSHRTSTPTNLCYLETNNNFFFFFRRAYMHEH